MKIERKRKTKRYVDYRESGEGVELGQNEDRETETE